MNKWLKENVMLMMWIIVQYCKSQEAGDLPLRPKKEERKDFYYIENYWKNRGTKSRK